MVPVTPAAVSLFGAPQNVSPILSPYVDSAAELAMGRISPSSSSVTPGLIPDTTRTAASAPFADLLTEAVGQVEKLEGQARSAVEGLMSGKGVDVHEAMIATEKADMGFQMVLSVRNKALSAYQQVMGMQF